MKDVVRLSRYLCRVLRHHPEEIELKIDDRGWADTTELIEKVNTKKKIDMETLEYIVENDQKGRYSFNEDTKSLHQILFYTTAQRLDF